MEGVICSFTPNRQVNNNLCTKMQSCSERKPLLPFTYDQLSMSNYRTLPAM